MAVVVVTGSASGIGAAVAERQRAEGHRVIGVDLRSADVEADLSNSEGRESALAAIREAGDGRLDRLVLCAGLGPETKPLSLVPSVNYFGAVELLDGLFDALTSGSEPSVVAICSNSAKMAPLDDHPYVKALLAGDETEARRLADENPGFVAYAGSKNALGRAVRHRAVTWGKAGVRLNAVAPGPTNTPMLESGMKDPTYGKFIESIDLPLGRRAEPAEIATLVSFLLSPDAAFVHGAVYFIDGGNDAEVRPDAF